MKQTAFKLSKSGLFHNIVYIDDDPDLEKQQIKTTKMIEFLYGNLYGEYGCSYQCKALPIKNIVVNDEIKQLHHIIVNVTIPESNYKAMHNRISFMSGNISKALENNTEEWEHIIFIHSTDYFCNSKYTHVGFTGHADYMKIFQDFPKSLIPSINFYMKGGPNVNLKRVFLTGNFNNCEIDIEIYDSLMDGMAHRPTEWYQTFCAYPYNFYITRDYHMAGEKIYGFTLNNTLIFTDEKIERDDIIPSLINCKNILLNTHIIFLNKYHVYYNHFVSVVNDNFMNWSTLYLYRVNQEKLQNIVMHGNVPRASITAQYNETYTPQLFVNWEYSNRKLSRSTQFIIPYKANEDKHIKTLELINELFKYQALQTEEDIDEVSRLFSLYYNHYLKDLPLIEGRPERDALIDWFEMCSSTAYDEQAQLKKAYINLKSNLEKEYKDASIYLRKYDLSKKKAIPSIELEECLTHKTDKQLSFTMNQTTYNKLNNMNLLEPIICEDILVRTITKAPRSRGPIYSTNDLSKFLDIKNNKVYIDIDTIMKRKEN